MRSFAGSLLVFLSIPLFLAVLLSATLKFQLLQPRFWETAFEGSNVYSSLSAIVKQSVINQTVKEGGKASEISAITDIINPANVKDFVNKNLEHILNYANGQSRELFVYIPVSKFPKAFLPSNFSSISEDITLVTLLKKLDIKGIDAAQIQYISHLGKWSGYLFAGAGLLLVLFWGLLFLLTKPAGRFGGPGLAFILDGLTALSLYFYAGQLRSQLGHIAGSSNTAGTVLVTLAPPLITEIVKTWLVAGIFLVALGIVLFFLRKPAYNQEK